MKGGVMGRRFARSTAIWSSFAFFAGAALAAPAATPVTVNTSSSALGTTVVVSGKGLTLYHYTGDTIGRIRCGAACAFVFPPLVVPAGSKPVAGPGVSAAKLGTIRRPDGRLQVTYNGLTLYVDYYDKPGQAKGQGEQGVWFAVTPSGAVTKLRASTPETKAASPPSASPPAAAANPAGNGTPGPITPEMRQGQDLGCGVLDAPAGSIGGACSE
jgi:predicted lipoprotein with Yx(FWY)xxD motif